MQLCRLITVSLLLTGVSPYVYYVRRSGRSEGATQVNSIQDCVDMLSGPGGQCLIPPGVYHENVTISGKHGSEIEPIVIGGSGKEPSIIDGTVPLNPKQWEKIGDGFYKTTIEQDIWQLFIDDVMMTNARWPNSLWSDKSIFLNKYWAKSSPKSKVDVMVDDGSQNLMGSGLNMTGAMAILNIGSFNTFTAVVKSHAPKSNRFTYDAKSFGKVHFKAKHNQYFMEDKLELLDQPGEWFYDKGNRILYVKTNDGRSPKGRDVRGKVQTYAFSITNCTNVIFKDMTFFATTLRAASISKDNFVDNLAFHSLNFSYPSYSKRMLGETDPPEWTSVNTEAGKGKERVIGRLEFFNNTFYGSDGVALEYSGVNVTVQNNLFEFNDWTCANMKRAMGGMGTVVSHGLRDKFIRNTFRFNGASAGIRPSAQPQVMLNHIHHQCWGIIQHDGAGVQTRVGPQTNAILQYNWVHSSPKYGLRFDGEPPKIGRHGTMKYNVVWRCNGIMVKGDEHTVLNNLAFDKYNEKGDSDMQGTKCMLCVLRYVRKNPVPINNSTVVTANAADTANGGVHKDKLYPLAGITKHNVEKNVKQDVVDAYNMDFRPRKDSRFIVHSVGPYKYEARMAKYWIPGRQLYKPSTPVPPDSSTTVKVDRDAVMWLNAYGAKIHHVYFGTNKTAVESATRSSREYQKTTRLDRNVWYLGFKLEPGTEYFWRVDAQRRKRTVYKGDVWRFTTENQLRLSFGLGF